MENPNLKFINIEPWNIPRPYRDQQVRIILDKILTMKPGEFVQVEVPPERVGPLRSVLWHQIRRHELGAVVITRDKKLYLRKIGEEAPHRAPDVRLKD